MESWLFLYWYFTFSKNEVIWIKIVEISIKYENGQSKETISNKVVMFEHFIITCSFNKKKQQRGFQKHWTIELKEISKVNGGDCHGNMLNE